MCPSPQHHAKVLIVTSNRALKPADLGAWTALHQLIGQGPHEVSKAEQLNFKRRPLSSYFAVVLVSQSPF
jgi:hypothetical protein